MVPGVSTCITHGTELLPPGWKGVAFLEDFMNLGLAPRAAHILNRQV